MDPPQPTGTACVFHSTSITHPSVFGIANDTCFSDPDYHLKNSMPRKWKNEKDSKEKQHAGVLSTTRIKVHSVCGVIRSRPAAVPRPKTKLHAQRIGDPLLRSYLSRDVNREALHQQCPSQRGGRHWWQTCEQMSIEFARELVYGAIKALTPRQIFRLRPEILRTRVLRRFAYVPKGMISARYFLIWKNGCKEDSEINSSTFPAINILSSFIDLKKFSIEMILCLYNQFNRQLQLETYLSESRWEFIKFMVSKFSLPFSRHWRTDTHIFIMPETALKR